MLAKDVRYAIRNLWSNRGFAVVAVICLSLGIGLNTTIFSVVDGVLIQSFPYVEADRIVVPSSANQKADVTFGGLSYLDLRDWREQNTAFSAIAGVEGRSLTIADGGEEPTRYVGAAVSWDLFPLLGTEPVLGHVFTADDDKPGAERAVILGYDIWTQRYQSDRAVLGRRILVNARPHVIIGVMPAHFAFPQNQKLWIPVAHIEDGSPRSARNLSLYARLKPGVTIDRARAELVAMSGTLARQYPDTNDGWSAEVRPLRDAFIPPDVRQVILLMMAAATLVLLIACANVANLLLARASVRRKEISIRTALGAGRGRIVRQLLTESVVLGLLSVPLGLALAWVGDRLLTAAMPPDGVPAYIQWHIDWRSMSYATLVAAGTMIVFGLIPAWQASAGNLHETLKEGTRGNTGDRAIVRNTLVVVEVALSLVALVGALLFVRTFSNLDTYPIGFDSKPLMTMRYYLPGEPYEAPDAKARRVEDIVERVERLPGVQAAFSSNLIPMNGGGGGGRLVIDGRAVEKGALPPIGFVGVTPHFYRTLNVALERGRDFTEAEGWSRTPNAIINHTMAARFWPKEDPIGRRFRLSESGEAPDWFTIIGVAPDIKQDQVNPDARPFPVAYVPYIYQQALNTGLTIRMAGDPSLVTAAARGEIRAADANLPVFQVNTMEKVRQLSFWQYGIFGWVFSTIGLVGLLLAAVGVYGVLSYSVAQRQQEIGVRMALGAERRDVLRLVVGQGMRLAGLGVAVGIAAAAIALPFARQVLYNVSPFDPASFITVAVFLAGVAAFASYVPALRAARVNPVVALRGE
jgi:predicted permease